MCTELASLTSRIWIFRSFTRRFVIEPDIFIGNSPLEKGNLHESAVRKTIGLSPEADMAAGLPSGSAPKAGLIAHGTRIRPKEGTDPVDSTQGRRSTDRIDSSPASPIVPFPKAAHMQPLLTAECHRIDRPAAKSFPQRTGRKNSFPQDTVSKEIQNRRGREGGAKK
jgi:hypothetical protein